MLREPSVYDQPCRDSSTIRDAGAQKCVSMEVAKTVDLSDADLLVLYTDVVTEVDRNAVEGERKIRAARGGIDLARRLMSPPTWRKSSLPKQTDDLAILVVRCDGK